jgi:hypothetical protein
MPLVVKCSALDAPPDGLYGDAQDLSGLRHGDALPTGLWSVLTHGPMLDPSEATRKPLDGNLMRLAARWVISAVPRECP